MVSRFVLKVFAGLEGHIEISRHAHYHTAVAAYERYVKKFRTDNAYLLEITDDPGASFGMKITTVRKGKNVH